MVDAPKRRRGRPPSEPKGGKRHNVTVTMADPIRRQIGAAADRKGRSISSEIDYRLGLSFALEEDAGGLSTRRLLDFARLASVSVRNGFGAEWDENAEAALALLGAIESFIVAVAPEPQERVRERELDTHLAAQLDQWDALRDAAMRGEYRPENDEQLWVESMSVRYERFRLEILEKQRRARGEKLMEALIDLMSGTKGDDHRA